MTDHALCNQCCFYMGNKEKHGTEGLCWRFPPMAFPMPVQSMIGAQPKLSLVMTRPTVDGGHFCGEFMQKPDVHQN